MKKSFTQITVAVAMYISLGFTAKAQLSENFADGDFAANPAWTGNTADWIINAAQQLQSNNTTANSVFYLSTANVLATQTQWQFYLRLAFSTSGSNYADVWLTASASNLTMANTTGYFVRVGNTADEISLYRKDANGSEVKIIDGLDGVVGGSNNTFEIKVTRDANNQWALYRDISGTGSNYISEGTAADATFLTSSYFGIVIKQSTASFFQKHYLDDIEIKAFVPDANPPSAVSAAAVSANSLNLVFNEPVDKASAESITNYSVNNSIGQPSSATIDAANPAAVTLVFASNFADGVTNIITINGVKDIAGNTLTNGTAGFSFYTLGLYDIVISEIMADPTPVVGLPEAEWVELKNTSPVPINLQGYKIGKPGGMSGAFPSLLLAPDSAVIVCTSSQLAALSGFGRAVSVTSFPSLGNDGDLLILQMPNGTTMHAVEYSSAWYQNAVKANGGWTLEMIDTHNPCAGITNWKASVDGKGGTPGRKNSVDAINTDATAPNLLRAYAKDSVNLVLFFDEPMDSASAVLASKYNISDGVGAAISATPQGPLFNKVSIVLGNKLAFGKTYTVTVSGLTDCAGNAIDGNTAKLGLASAADSLDVIVNEILFDPKPLGVDYLELYNRGNKIIDLSSLYITNRSSTTGALGTPIQLTTENYLLFPNEFVVATTDVSIVQNLYTVKNPAALLQMGSLPSFPDDKGTAVVLNSAGQITDELNYSYKWHFALVDDEEGVALERIDYSKPTNDASNWTSAASSAGFGTPTYQNSQFRADMLPQGEITISPKMFSPDNDGFEDFAFINFQFPEPGYVANVSIFDAAGRPVRVLQRNTTTAASGSFRWDGLNDKQQKVPVGTYIIYTDIFNLKGQKKTFKNTVIVVRKL
jgi:hypothetical protein